MQLSILQIELKKDKVSIFRHNIPSIIISQDL